MSDQQQADGIEVEVVTFGPLLYNDMNEVVGYSVDHIKDTTGRGDGLPVLLKGVRVGTAFSMTTAKRRGYDALVFGCRVWLASEKIETLREPDGLLLAAKMRTAGSIRGFYPHEIHLTWEDKDE